VNLKTITAAHGLMMPQGIRIRRKICGKSGSARPTVVDPEGLWLVYNVAAGRDMWPNERPFRQWIGHNGLFGGCLILPIKNN